MLRWVSVQVSVSGRRACQPRSAGAAPRAARPGLRGAVAAGCGHGAAPAAVTGSATASTIARTCSIGAAAGAGHRHAGGARWPAAGWPARRRAPRSRAAPSARAPWPRAARRCRRAATGLRRTTGPSAWRRSAPAGSRAARPTACTCQHRLLRRQQLGRLHHRLQRVHRPRGGRSPASSARSDGAVGVAQRDAQQEAVELALGQRVGAELVARVLRGDDEEGLGQRRGSRFPPRPAALPSPRAARSASSGRRG